MELIIQLILFVCGDDDPIIAPVQFGGLAGKPGL
jgi:hypothetical protein